MIFRDALPKEAKELTELTFKSKKYWGYPDKWMEIWTDELTINSEYIEKNMVILAEENKRLPGYISIIEHRSEPMVTVGEHHVSDGFFLDNLFVHPCYIRKGIGKKLTNIAFCRCKEKQIEKIYVYSDPNAKGFYEKMGALCLGEVATGDMGRALPLLVFEFNWFNHISPLSEGKSPGV